MSITTDLARFVTPRPDTCGSCAAGLVFIADGEGRYTTHQCPCIDAEPIEHLAEVDAPIPDPNTPHEEEN